MKCSGEGALMKGSQHPGASSQLAPCPDPGQAFLNQEVCFNYINFAGAVSLGFPVSGTMRRNKFLLLIAIQFIAFLLWRQLGGKGFYFLGKDFPGL